MKSGVLAVLVLILVVELAGPVGAVSSSFDSGLDGWTATQPGEIQYSTTDGNPDGYLRFVDDTPSHTYVIAPSAFLGDWSAGDGVGSISFDHRIFEIISFVETVDYEILIAGNGNSATWISPGPPGVTNWRSLSALLVESEWTVTGSWSDLLSSVEDFRISIEMVDGFERSGIDNIRLYTGASPVPAPGAILLGAMGAGFVGWLHRRGSF